MGKPSHYPKETIAKAKSLFMIGGKSRDIAQALGIPDVSVRQWINRHKWVRDRELIITKSMSKLDKVTNTLAVRAIADHQLLVKGAVDGIIGKIAQSKSEKPLDLLNLANALDKADTTGRRNVGLSTDTDSAARSGTSINLFLGSEEPPEAIDITPKE